MIEKEKSFNMKYLKYVVFCMATLCFIPKVAASHTVKYKEYTVQSTPGAARKDLWLHS